MNVPIATMHVEAKCILLLTLPQPNNMIPRNEASKKKAVKTAASLAAKQPIMPMKIGDVMKLLRDNPEYGIAFHKHFAERRDSLMSDAWATGSDNFDMKAVAAALFISEEILASFGLEDLDKR